MEQRTLGRTGRSISEIGLGTWQIGGDWGDVAEADAFAVLNAFRQKPLVNCRGRTDLSGCRPCGRPAGLPRPAARRRP